MGQCVGTRPPRSQELEFSKQPKDTEQFSHLQLPKLQFQALLANVKIKSCPYVSMAIRFAIQKVQSFGLSRKQIRPDGSAKWRIQHKIGFQMTEYQLRKNFLILDFQDQHDVTVGTLRMNMYILSTGPYHQDFAVDFKKKLSTSTAAARVSFDFRVSQIIELRLESVMCEMELSKKHPGEKFNFSIKTMVDHNSLISMPSYTVLVMLDNKEKDEVNLEEGIDSEDVLKVLQQQNTEARRLSNSSEKPVSTPSLTRKKTKTVKVQKKIQQAFDLHHACFQILLWKINDKNNQQESEKAELYSECYISFQKLFLQQYRSTTIDGHIFEERTIDVEEKLWSHGQEFGKGRFKFRIRNQKYIKQMQVCIRTQQGILKSSPVFDLNKKVKNDSNCYELASLITISEEIEANVEALEKQQTRIQRQSLNQNSTPIVSSQIRILQTRIEKGLKSMIPILEKTVKQSLIFYDYSSLEQMRKGQKTFIGIGIKILAYIQEEDPLINEICWGILIALLRRGEFNLCYIGFDDKQKTAIECQEVSSELKKKIEIALQYQQWIYKLLQLALNSLNVKGHECERTFAELFCVYAYFRIPTFRNQILQAICREDDPQILEWRGIEFSLNEDIIESQLNRNKKSFQESNIYVLLFDWGNHFHKCLEKEERYQANNNDLQEMLMSPQWRQRMAKRGTAFFYFLRFWVRYVQQIVVKSKDIQWKEFPGYNRLIWSFLAQAKKRNILQYPDALKQTMSSLLSNSKLVNAFVTIVLNKGNMHQPLTVLKTIQIISMLFETLTQKKCIIPHTFNYLSFYKSIKIVLESQFSHAISHMLTMLYNHFPLFSKQFKRNLSLYLLGKVFFRLFLHWSHNVRIVFYYLITIRIYHETHALHTSSNHGQMKVPHEEHQEEENCRYKYKTNEDIKRQYQRVLNMINNADKIKTEEGKGQIRVRYEKQLYKKMKKKMILRKKNNKALGNEQTADQVMGLNNVNGKKNRNSEDFIGGHRENAAINCESSQVLSESAKSADHAKSNFFTQSQIPLKIQRTHSEIMSKPNVSFFITHRQGRTSKKQQVINFNKSNSFRYKHEVVDTTNGPSNQTKHMIKLPNLYDESDYEIEPLTRHHLAYINMALKEFHEVNSIFVKFQNNGGIQPPKVKSGIVPIDQKEIRPDQIDDW